MRIHHESLRRFIVARLTEEGRPLRALLDPVIAWLDARGLFADDRAFRFLLPLLRRAHRDDDLLARVRADFVASSVIELQPQAAVEANLTLAALVAGARRDFPALVRLAELKTAAEVALRREALGADRLGGLCHRPRGGRAPSEPLVVRRSSDMAAGIGSASLRARRPGGRQPAVGPVSGAAQAVLECRAECGAGPAVRVGRALRTTAHRFARARRRALGRTGSAPAQTRPTATSTGLAASSPRCSVPTRSSRSSTPRRTPNSVRGHGSSSAWRRRAHATATRTARRPPGGALSRPVFPAVRCGGSSASAWTPPSSSTAARIRGRSSRRCTSLTVRTSRPSTRFCRAHWCAPPLART